MKKIFYIAALCGIVCMTGVTGSCEKDKQLPPEENVERVLPPIEDIDEGEEDPDAEKDYFHAINFLQVENVDTDGSGIDLATGKVFRGMDVHNNIHAIDLLYLDFGNATSSNIALPESRELSVNAYGEDIQYGWRHKNAGVLYRLEDVQPRDVEWFNGAKSAVRISAVVDSMITVLSADPGNQKQRYRNVHKDQILIFKSIDRNIASLIYVNHRGITTSGSNLRLVIKTDATQLQEVPPVIGGLLNANGNFYADVMEASFPRDSKVALLFDFEKKKITNVYTEQDIDAIDDFSGLGMIFTFDANDARRHRILSPRSPSIATYDSGISAYLTTRENQLTADKSRPSNTYMYRVTVTNAQDRLNANPFDGVRLSNKSLKDYFDIFRTTPVVGEQGNAWNNNQAVNNIWIVRHTRSDGGDAYGAFRFVSVDKAATGQGDGKVVFEVKYWNSLD